MWFSDSLCRIIWLSLVGIVLTGCGGGGGGSSPTANTYDGNWMPKYTALFIPTIGAWEPPICMTPASAILTIANGSGSISFTQTCIDKRTSAIISQNAYSINVTISSAGVINIDNGYYTGTCSSTDFCSAGASSGAFSLTRTAAQLPLPAQPPVASNLTLNGTTHTGQTLTAGYFYSDANNDPEGISIYRWERDGVAITGATNITYTLTAADLNTIITFWVTPVAQTGTYLTGTPVGRHFISPISAGIVQGGLTWSDAKTGYVYNWADANTYCTTSTINALTGWRLPTPSELNSYMLSSISNTKLYSSSEYWTSSISTILNYYHVSVSNYTSPFITDSPDSSLLYAICVR